MDKNEEKTPAATSADATEPVAANNAPVETGNELQSVESPALAPTAADANKTSGPAAARIEQFETAEGLADASTPRPKGTDLGAQHIIPFVAAARASGAASADAPRRFSKSTLFAASVVIAAAFGAMAGVLGATGVARFASEPAAAPAPDPTVALQSALTQLRSEVAALKAGVDASGRNSTAQYNKLVERFDRLERAQSVATKTDAALPKEAALAKDTAKDVTGSIPPASPGAAGAPVAPPPSTIMPGPIVPGWAVRDVYRGVAMLQSRVGGMVEVEPGDILPGLGRIEAIRRQDGRWVVITSHGMIVSMR